MTLSFGARMYRAAIVLAAAALQAVLFRTWGGSLLTASDVPLTVLLIALAVLAQHVPLQAGPQRKVDTSVAVYFSVVLLLGPALTMATVALAQMLGQGTLALRRDGATGARRGTVRSVAFNTAQFALAAGLAGAAYHALVPPVSAAGPATLMPLDRVEILWALPTAAVAMLLVNSGAVALMIGLQRGKNPLAVWWSGRGADLLQYGALFAVGLSMALLACQQAWAVLLMVIPAAIVHLALRQTLALLAREQSARADADQALRTRDEFISVAAHELKNPLAGLLGYTQLLLRNGEDGSAMDREEQRETLEVIAHQARRLERLIGQLLDSRRIEAGKLALERSRIDVVGVIRGVVSAARAGNPEQRIDVRAPTHAVADVDAPRLEQVLANLVENAIKYSPAEASIEVQLTRTVRSAGGVTESGPETLRIAVRDHGVGIPVEHREHIFDRYYQAHGEGHLAGLGLGLYISRCIVEAHGGQISVESPPDGGTRFVVELPSGAVTEAATSAAGGVMSVVPRVWAGEAAGLA